MLKVETDNAHKKKVTELRVLEILKSIDYSLNVVNRYKENLVHVCAANDCVDLLECIVQKHGKQCLLRKNAFGWTPIMHAIRNENVDAIKCLLSHDVIVNDFSFLGLSVMSLASAISFDMFELIYNNNPSALEYASNDDINPLCIAALKNDERLFFKLLDLGMDVRKSNPFAITMMKQSTIPAIRQLADMHLNSIDYWNDVSDIKDVLLDDQGTGSTKDSNDILLSNCARNNFNEPKTELRIPKLSIELVESARNENTLPKKKPLKLHLQPEEETQLKSLISPVLSYFHEFSLPVSPNTFIDPNTVADEIKNPVDNMNLDTEGEIQTFDQVQSNTSIREEFNATSPSLVLQRCQDRRPENLKIRNSSEDSNVTLSFTPQFSPTKTPNLPKDISEDNVFDELTPTPPKYRTPPRGIILDENTKKLMLILKKFGLKRHICTFIEQEVDLDLFLTLTDNDLYEIGINSKSERLILLSVIKECKENLTCEFKYN